MRQANRRSASLVFTTLSLIIMTLGGGQPVAAGRDLYVAPNGLPANDGSLARPLDLATALSGSLARPSDRIWLRGGIYLGSFTSKLTGSLSQPITVRPFPGERATLDARSPAKNTLDIYGAHTVYWGFEVTNSNPVRTTGTALNVFGVGTKLINLVIHDGGASGIGFWAPAIGAELYGSIIYNNGFERERGYGHSLYTQNKSGVKLIVDNIMFNSFSFGIHGYTQDGAVDNFDIEGNILFNHGVLSPTSGAKSNMILGGRKAAHNAVVRHNYTYYPSGLKGRGSDIGYVMPCENATIEDNYFVGDTAIDFNCVATPFTSNELYGVVSSHLNSIDVSNTVHMSRPTGAKVYVRPNKYEPGRANVAIYNWDLLPEVSVDLSHVTRSSGEPLLGNGQAFEIYDAQNFYGPPIVSGIYVGLPIAIPMTGLSAAQPLGVPPRPAVHTAPEFGAFVLLPKPKPRTF